MLFESIRQNFCCIISEKSLYDREILSLLALQDGLGLILIEFSPISMSEPQFAGYNLTELAMIGPFVSTMVSCRLDIFNF